MRYISNIPFPVSPTVNNTLRKVAGIRATKRVVARHKEAVEVQQQLVYKISPEASANAKKRRAERRSVSVEERRKDARRQHDQPVLLELRSDIDQRRHHLRDGDTVEHVDIKV